MRRLIVPIAIVLALTTGAWIGQAYMLLGPLSPAMPLGSPEPGYKEIEGTIHRFYDAVSILLATGDPTAVQLAVADDFVDHAERPGLAPTRAGLIRYLASLREVFPNLRIQPQEVVVDGDRVAVQVDILGNLNGSFLGFTLDDTRTWAHIDVFRVAGGRVAEHWDDLHGQTIVETVASVPLSVPDGPPPVPSLTRLTFAPGASDEELGQWGSTLMLVETGQLDVEVAGNGKVAVQRSTTAPGTGRLSKTETLTQGGVALLLPGDLFQTSNAVSVVTRNAHTAPATALVLTLHTPRAHAMAFDSTVSLAPGITTNLLGTATAAAIVPGIQTMAVGRVTLSPGGHLARHNVTMAEFAVVESGSVTATFDSDTGLSEHREGRTTTIREVVVSGSLTLPHASNVLYRNRSAEPLTVILVVIGPSTRANTMEA